MLTLISPISSASSTGSTGRQALIVEGSTTSPRTADFTIIVPSEVGRRAPGVQELSSLLLVQELRDEPKRVTTRDRATSAYAAVQRAPGALVASIVT